MRRYLFLLLLTAICTGSNLYGQEFIKSLEKRDGDFYQIQKEAADYFNIKGSDKGSGYKQYKRIEWFLSDRVYPSGDMSLVNGIQLYKEILAFNDKYPATKAGENRWTPVSLVKYDNVDGHWSPGTGRMDRVMVDPSDNRIIYTGAPTGGLWKSVDGGITWEAKTDNLPTIGICGIAINPVNSNIVYIATGDGDGGGTYSTGVFRSDDGGDTWTPTSLTFEVTANVQGKKLIIHPVNPDILFFTSTSGIYKTTDAGASWKRVVTGSFDDIEFKPGDPSLMYATQNDAFFRSEDSGDTFTPVNVTATGRIIIGVTQAAPSYVYLACGNEGIYLSTDNGKTFTLRGDHPFEDGLKWYMWGFAVSQTNPSILQLGMMESYKSTNGGLSWDIKTTEWLWGNSVGYTHCDFHEMKYFGNTLYVCTDGGLAKSTDDGENWTVYFNGLETTQIFNIAVCKSDPSKLMFGSQDNGVYYYNGTDWWGWLGADGMDVLFDYNNPSTRYATIQRGQIYCSDHTISQAGTGAWVTPIAIHPTDHNTFYIATDVVRKSTNGMASWTTIGNVGSGYKKALTVAESDPNYIYVSEGSKIWRTSNGGSLWTDISAGLPNRVITRIAVHPSDPLRVAITFSGYAQGEKVYFSENGGASWVNYSRNLPNIPANAIVFDNNESNSLYIGMDVGVYYTDENLALWEAYSDGLPNSIVTDLEMNWPSGMLFAGTYGRGMWKVTARTPGVTDLPSKASEPSPVSGSAAVSKNTTLAWSPGTQTETHRVYFGSADPPPFVGETSTNNFNPGALEASTTYYWRVDETNTMGTTAGDTWYFITDAFCTARGLPGTTSDYIKRVQLADIDNSSGMAYYEDYSDISTDLVRGNEYTLTVSLVYHWTADTVAAWIDWDHNESFSADEEITMQLLDINHISTGTITVPEDAPVGPAKLRIRNSYNESPVPCGDAFGEVEDYTVVITADNSLLPGMASEPVPGSGAINLPPDQTIRWKGGLNADSHRVYFGVNQTPGDDQFKGVLNDTIFDPGDLMRATTYYWRIDEENSFGIRNGQIWSFTTDAFCDAVSNQEEDGNYIKRVVIGEIDNSTALESYSIYYMTESQFVTDSGYETDIYLDRNETGAYVSLWFDWNGDNQFTTDEMTVIDNFDALGKGSVVINIPGDALPGTTRMRVRLLPEGTSDPCNGYQGETEDYVIAVAGEVAPPEKAINPFPLNSAEFISTQPRIEWIAGDRSTVHNVYFGTTSNPPFAGSVTEPAYEPGQLSENTDYYWRIDEENRGGVTTGTLWHFKTFDSSVLNPLKVDFGSKTTPVQSGYQPYRAVNNSIGSFKAVSYGALGNNIIVMPTWDQGALNEAAVIMDRGGDDNTLSPDILRDWIGTDKRVPGNPLTISISGLPAGIYNWTSYHHDPHDQTGLFNVTVNDATGSKTTSDIDISEGSIFIQNVTKFQTTVESDGSQVTLVFDKKTETGSTKSLFVMNGFILEAANGNSIDDHGSDPDWLNVYPNPAEDMINIEFVGKGTERVDIYDQLGKRVYSGRHYGNPEQVSLEGMPSGIYTVVLFKEGRLITRKFIIR